MAATGTDLDAIAARLITRVTGKREPPQRIDRGYSNLVWVTDDLVLRMSASPGSRNLLREAQLAELLPEPVGYPRVIGAGTAEEREWIITERLIGEQLEAMWPMLSDEARVLAVETLWDRLQSVQRTDVTRARAIGCTHTPFYALNENAAAALVDELASRRVFDLETQASARRLLELLFSAMKEVPEVLNHTDAGLHNTLWNGSESVPVDFEFACVAPVDLDLEMLLRQLMGPSPTRSSQMLIELAQRHITRFRSRDRLVGYALLRDLWALRLWLRYADSYGPDRGWPPKDTEQWDPWQRVMSHARNESNLKALWE